VKAINRRLRRLEERHIAQRNEHGLNPAVVLRQRICRRMAAETGRPYEELLRESEMESQAFWASYDGDRSIVGILRSRFDRKVKPTLGSGCASGIEPMRRSDD
jgi:hypothetical protein